MHELRRVVQFIQGVGLSRIQHGSLPALERRRVETECRRMAYAARYTAGCVQVTVPDRRQHRHGLCLPFMAGEERLIAGDNERWVGRRVGAYEILALIGSGGMGEVYRARRVDAEYEKEVAIKLVPGAQSDRAVLERLRAERQILAKLDHPNIARLIDGGVTEDGLPYLIMDLIDGEPLDRYCERRQLPIPERLRLFREVCSAVSYAHQHFIVHRDLKPRNILVTADGTPKLLDFGIAKLVQPTLTQSGAAATVFGANPLTLEFASPEQVRGGTITTTSDVYSLGMVLYLLLTGRLPYRTSFESLLEAMREICEVEPARPSTLAARADGKGGERIDRDLDAIVLRALRKEPDKRYRSVEEFSEDIARYLGGHPVTARDGRLTYRVAKFVRRHKLEIAAGVLITGALVGGIVTSLRQARIAAQETARAERHVATVRAFADAAMFQLHDAIKDLPGSTKARQILVSTALEYLNALAAEAGKDRTLQREIATAYIKVADIQGKVNKANTGRPAEAMESYAKAIALLEPLVASDPGDASARRSLAQSYLQQSRLFVWRGEPQKAVAMSRKATEMFDSLVSADSDMSSRMGLADACRVHAVNLVLAGSGKEGIRYAERSVRILEDLQRRNTEDLDLMYELGVAYGSAADVHQADETPEAPARSNELRHKALAVDERLVEATGGHNATYARSLFGDRVNLCSQHNDAGEYLKAVEYCRAAQPLLVSLRTDENNAQIELDGTSLRLNLGSALLGAGRLDEAGSVLEENVRALRKLLQQSDTMQVQYLLAASEEGLGRIESQRAASAQMPRAERLRRWRLAKEWYEDAVPRFQTVASKLSLTAADMVPVNNAVAGLEKSRAGIEKLEGAAASASEQTPR
jgi:eukaryotic-like serine/threonine-protein kinase